MSSTHHLSPLYANRAHVILSLLFFAVLWTYLFYALRLVFCKFSTFAAGLFVDAPSADAVALGQPTLGIRESGADPSERLGVSAACTGEDREACRFGVRAGAKPGASIGSSSKVFLASLVVLLVARSPYVISMAPGSDSYDMGWQVAQFVNGGYSTHHPLTRPLFMV